MAESKAVKKPAAKNRIGLMDDLRGFCVLCMIFYHGFLLAFSSFGVVAGGQAYDFFRPVQPFFAGTFILLCGISCRLSHSNRDRGLKLLAVALAINLITILGLPRLKPLGFDFSGTEIWFGILDLLAVCILFFALTHRVLDWLPPAAGAYLMLVLWYVTRFVEAGQIGFPGELVKTLPAEWSTHFWTFPLGIHTATFWSADYFPLLPWMFLFLAGCYFGIYIREGHVPDFARKSRLGRPINWLGRHALLVYIVHVPAWFVVLELAHLIHLI